jgi:hypothetical protein
MTITELNAGYKFLEEMAYSQFEGSKTCSVLMSPLRCKGKPALQVYNNSSQNNISAEMFHFHGVHNDDCEGNDLSLSGIRLEESGEL